MPHMCKQKRKRPTPVRRRLRSWEGHSGRVGAGVVDESAESRKFVQPLRLPLEIYPVRRTYVVVVVR